jgi:hypothetical protein
VNNRPERNEKLVAAVVSIRGNEGSLSVWHETAMRFELAKVGDGRSERGFGSLCAPMDAIREVSRAGMDT